MKANSTKKRIGALALAMALALGMLAGCGQTTAPAASAPAASAPAASTPAPAAPAVPEEPVLPTMEDEFGNGAVGTKAAVTSADPLASQAGVDIMMAGGNAVDAAVATAFCVGVLEPWLSGIGGCGMMNIYLHDSGEYEVLEYMETVPVAIEPGWYDPSTDSATAKNAAVPGQVLGLLTALEKYGTMSREEVMAPAIELARDGFPMSERLAASVNDNYDIFTEEALAIYTNDGIPYAAGEIIKNEPLAATLQAISDGGAEVFYTGEIAQKMIDGLQAAGSLMAMEDLADYEVMEREPITTTYYGYEVVTVPPPSNGGDWLLEMLNIMEEEDIAQYEHNSAEYLYVFNEANRIALQDSYSYIGDPAFFNLPIAEMTSKEFAAERAELINVTDELKIMEEVPLSNLPVEKLNPTGEESQHTTHIVVMDPDGNIVSTTNTLGNGWGCKFYAPGLGFYYNSHVGNLDHSNPDSPDYVMPGKRVRSTISPSFVLKDGEPVMAIGSPGSLAIPPAIAGVINNVLLYDMELQNAVNAPRAQAITRSSGRTNTMTIELGLFDADLVAELEAMGYVMNDCGEYSSSVGGIAALYLDNEAGVIYAAGDPRRGYYSAAE